MTLPNEVKDAPRATAQIDVEQLRKLVTNLVNAFGHRETKNATDALYEQLGPAHILALLDRLEAAESATPQPAPAQGVSDAEDAARLAFMIDERCVIDKLSRPTGAKFRIFWPDEVCALKDWYSTPHEAIDAARSAQTNGGGNG